MQGIFDKTIYLNHKLLLFDEFDIKLKLSLLFDKTLIYKCRISD